LKKIKSLSSKKCRICKKLFVPNAKTTVMCSDICRFMNRRDWEADNNKSKRELRMKKVKKIKCRNCLKIFIPAAKTRIFCSRGCSGSYNFLYKNRKKRIGSPASKYFKKHKYRNYEISKNLNTPEQKERHRLEINVALEKFLRKGGKIEKQPSPPLPKTPSVGSRDWPWEYTVGLGYYGMEELNEPETNIEELTKK